MVAGRWVEGHGRADHESMVTYVSLIGFGEGFFTGLRSWSDLTGGRLLLLHRYTPGHCSSCKVQFVLSKYGSLGALTLCEGFFIGYELLIKIK